jgi:signal transduction histidine kinase
VVDILRPQAPEGLRIEFEDAAGSEPFVMAPDAVHQCLLNLALNAMEALQSRPEQAGDPPFLRLAVNHERLPDGSDSILYTVSDNGPGMPEEVMRDAARTFWTSKATGSGIGLFATRKLAHEMGADIRFVSTPGQGAQAMLRLKAAIE